jgi:hypothetical protein
VTGPSQNELDVSNSALCAKTPSTLRDAGRGVEMLGLSSEKPQSAGDQKAASNTMPKTEFVANTASY